MSYVKINEDMAEWIWEKWNDGYTQTDIAKALNVTKMTIYRTVGKMQDAGRVYTRKGRKRKDGDKLSYDCAKRNIYEKDRCTDELVQE